MHSYKLLQRFQDKSSKNQLIQTPTHPILRRVIQFFRVWDKSSKMLFTDYLLFLFVFMY